MTTKQIQEWVANMTKEELTILDLVLDEELLKRRDGEYPQDRESDRVRRKD